MSDKSIRYYANLAYRILDNNTKYYQNKQLIKSLFEPQDENLTLDKIIHRLTLIDSFYSTQMDRRLFGIEDLAEAILNLSKDKDKDKDSILMRKINYFLSKETTFYKDIKEFFDGKYGINKRGEDNKKAVSLISKYFYFLMEYKFPIYDSLFKENLPELNNKFNVLNLDSDQIKKFEKNYISYFEQTIKFNEESKIYDFDKLDSLCWLYGKIKSGSFSLLIDKEKYINLTKNIKFISKDVHKKMKDNKEQKITVEDEIEFCIKKKLLHKEDLSNIFSDDMIEFIKFVYFEESS